MLEKSYPGIWLFHCQADRRTHKTVLNSISNRQYQQRKNLLVGQSEIRMLNRLVTRKEVKKSTEQKDRGTKTPNLMGGVLKATIRYQKRKNVHLVPPIAMSAH